MNRKVTELMTVGMTCDHHEKKRLLRSVLEVRETRGSIFSFWLLSPHNGVRSLADVGLSVGRAMDGKSTSFRIFLFLYR